MPDRRYPVSCEEPVIPEPEMELPPEKTDAERLAEYDALRSAAEIVFEAVGWDQAKSAKGYRLREDWINLGAALFGEDDPRVALLRTLHGQKCFHVGDWVVTPDGIQLVVHASGNNWIWTRSFVDNKTLSDQRPWNLEPGFDGESIRLAASHEIKYGLKT